MTDIYKKLYGYDDNIQLKDDDIKKLEAGMNLLKMRPNKTEFDPRNYRLDMVNNQILASTKELNKTQKICKFVKSFSYV